MKNKLYRVYRTNILDHSDRFYIGVSGKSDKDFESYFGSGKVTIECKKNNVPMQKIVLFETTSKATAKMVELLFQIKYIPNNPNCLNSMMNIRLNGNGIDWDAIRELGLIN